MGRRRRSDELAKVPCRKSESAEALVALTCKDGTFGAISGVCNHVGGPLGQGRIEGDYVVCPWHYYKFHWQTGEGEPGFEADRVPRHAVKVENGRVLVSAEARQQARPSCRTSPHPLARELEREAGPIRACSGSRRRR